MVKIKTSVLINTPLEIVWNAFVNQNNMTLWMKNLEKVEVIKGSLGEIGAIAHLHYREKGRPYILEDKMLSYEPEKKIVSQVSGQGMKILLETCFEKQEGTTQVFITWNGSGESILVKIVLRIMKNKIKHHATKELEEFKELVEEHGEDFTSSMR
ncbi:MAG: SRPBCC family protein [Candidatus Lokiarchaeota archaeon]|nr:SRPBCC family protein [Candidatus Lokiarchaeota archaeon]